jgi:hypothetical protein
MPKKPKKKNAVLAAHAAEQMEGHAKAFLLNLEHYGIGGVLYLKMPDNDDNIMVFTGKEENGEYIKLLNNCSACSLAGVKAILDKKK